MKSARSTVTLASLLLLATLLGASGPDGPPIASAPRAQGAERTPRPDRAGRAPRALASARAEALPALAPHPAGVWFLGRARHLGLHLIEVTPELRRHLGAADEVGVLVGSVAEESSAAKAGVQVGDLLTAVDGEPVLDGWDVRHLLTEREEGDTVRLEVTRDRRPLRLEARVDAGEDDGGLAAAHRARLLPRAALPELHWTFDARAPQAFDCGDADQCAHLGDDIRKYFEGDAWKKALKQVEDHRETLIDRVAGLEAKLKQLEKQLGQLERGDRR